MAEGEIAQKTPQLATIPWTATEKIPFQLAAQWQLPEINSDTLAYLQYTSGSTSTPKGVMLDTFAPAYGLAEATLLAGLKQKISLLLTSPLGRG